MTEEDDGEGLIRAIAAVARPLVRRLLAAQVPFDRVERGLRALFVEIAEREIALAHRAQSDGRVALLTGIDRKEVRRLRAWRAAAPPAPGRLGRQRAASLASRWIADPRALDPSGRPRPIPFRAARGPSFVKLARDVAAELPPQAILEELLRAGAVRQNDDGRVVLTAAGYVPERGKAEKLAMLGEDPAQLIETMLHNVFAAGAGAEPLLQRTVFFDNLGADAAPRVRAEVRRAAERFLRSMDRLLARYDRDRNPAAPQGARRGVGIGVYFFEEDRAARADKARAQSRASARTRAGRGGKPRR